jgi:hypothetical protein
LTGRDPGPLKLHARMKPRLMRVPRDWFISNFVANRRMRPHPGGVWVPPLEPPSTILVFPDYAAGILVFTQANEFGMSEVSFRRPFDELELSDKFWCEPSAIFHFFCRESLPPTSGRFLRKIHERAVVDLQAREFCCELGSGVRREAIASLRSVDQCIAAVVPEDERVEICRPIKKG